MEDITFKRYDNSDFFDSKFLRVLAKDKDISARINLIDGDKFIIIKNKENVGICIVNPVCYDMNAISISIGILERHRGLGVGTKALGMFTEKMLESECIDKIYLEIKSDNEISLKLADKLGFVPNISIHETFINEGYNYIPYVKSRMQYMKGREKQHV